MRWLSVRGASEHNLQHVDLDLPRNALVVVSGVSGSGKSSLVFDTIGREAQRRYLETFSSYTRQFLNRVARPAVESLTGLSPAITVDQRTTVRNPRSTVGTLTGLFDDLRLLFARLGTAPAGVTAERRLFSFNSPHGACPACSGLGVEDRLDPDLLLADPRKSIRDGALGITTPTGYLIYSQVTIDVLDQVCRAHGFDVETPWQDLANDQRHVVLYGSDRLRIPYGKHPLSSRLRWSGITARPREEGVYRGILPVMEQILKRSRNRNILRFVRSLPCRACSGTRLRPEALSVRFRARHIGNFASLDIEGLRREFERLSWSASEEPVGEPIRRAVLERAEVLQRLGLGHLAIDRVSSSLSGGEAQRLRLAAQLASGLRGVLYVLDEPSVGLHPSEHRQLLDVLRSLRDAGNTVLVVEHDEDTMRAADWLVDVGPGAAEQGGEVLFSGTVEEFLEDREPAGPGLPPRVWGEASASPSGLVWGEASASPSGFVWGEASASPSGLEQSRTRAFLLGTERLPVPAARRSGIGRIVLTGASRHNLQHIDVEFLAGAVNVVTGVSGAGKSSLLAELVERVEQGLVEARPSIGKVIHVDQSPIGRTPRSNPATYTGLSDVIRDLFAAQPEAVARGFGKGRFSFNVAGGRCEACQGAGVQQVGMHFLGSVDVVCDTCGGRRFNDETLAVTYRGLNIHDVLELTVDRAAGLVGSVPRAARICGLLRELGLGYLHVGQPSTTLSGGEAQRVKLAAELSRPGRRHTVYVLEEPTTGLHSADVAVLLDALRHLVEQGHTVITIEHHLGVIRAADRVVDLGPGSGRQGGRLVVAGTPEEVERCEGSVTGAALRGSFREPARLHVWGEASASPDASASPGASAAPDASAAPEASVLPPIRFTRVSTHNLSIPVIEIPANRFTVVTGVSGSGKSSFAFDTLYAEARNRFTESFSAYARRFVEKPGDAEFEAVTGLTPAVAVRQARPSSNPRSTVGTMTEIADYYRLLFARAGEFDCPSCGAPIEGGVACGECGWRDGLPLVATMFSPNAEQGACEACKGVGVVVECDPDRLVTHPARPLVDGAMDGHKTGRFYGDRHGQHVAILHAVGKELGLDFGRPWQDLGPRERDVAMRGAGDREFDVEWHYRRGARSGKHEFRSRWLGLTAYVGQEYARKHADRRAEALQPLMREAVCSACAGARLKRERLAVRVAGLDIAALQRMTVAESLDFFASFSTRVSVRVAAVTRDLRADVVARLEKLRDAGLDYVAIERRASTLSGGEAQRVRLSAEIGSGLTGITYVLDEPTAGLHARDTERLLGVIKGLRDAGNTVVVVEHDVDVMLGADHLVDLGPGAGDEGGRVVASGSASEMEASPLSLTGEQLRRRRAHAALKGRDVKQRPLRPGISVRHASRHNLRDLSVDVPAGGLVAVTGVSGSGKSTLVFDVIAGSLSGRLGDAALPLDRAAPLLDGPAMSSKAGPVLRAGRKAPGVLLHEPFVRFVMADAEGVARSPLSNPATVMGFAGRVRETFAATDAARGRGLTARHFSAQARGGRCEACEGAGRTRVSMDFLPDVWVPCDECGGRRFLPEVLACQLRGRSIADVLEGTVHDAQDLFAADASIAAPLRLLEEIGLGYVRVGQGTDTLSGGERQRLALASHLVSAPPSPSLYLFDEPTAGLHGADVGRLLQLFGRLVDAGHSLVVVEHHLDVIAAADHVIDLGPEGGAAGGRIVASGSPWEVARTAGSWTGAALARLGV